MSSKLKKIIKKVDPLMGGDAVLDKLGLPSVFGDEFGMIKEEQKIGSTALPEVAAAPTAVDPAALQAREDQRKRQLAASGLSANVLTRPGGLSSGANTQMKSLLGS